LHVQAAHALLEQLLASDALRALLEFAPQLTATAVEMSAQRVPKAKQMLYLGEPAVVSCLAGLGALLPSHLPPV
jgi:hypothetical protein